MGMRGNLGLVQQEVWEHEGIFVEGTHRREEELEEGDR